MIPVPSGVRVWLAVGHTDMRRGMNSLALQVQEKLRRDPHAVKPLPLQLLSDLLWAANGVNRPAEGGRTAPYWRHIIVLDTYAAMADGVWLYDPQTHRLLRHLREDIRADTGLQDFAASAPLNLVYVAHGERMHDISPEQRRFFASVDTGFIGQNVYLFCASEGLATVFRGAVPYERLEKRLGVAGGAIRHLRANRRLSRRVNLNRYRIDQRTNRQRWRPSSALRPQRK